MRNQLYSHQAPTQLNPQTAHGSSVHLRGGRSALRTLSSVEAACLSWGKKHN